MNYPSPGHLVIPIPKYRFKLFVFVELNRRIAVNALEIGVMAASFFKNWPPKRFFPDLKEFSFCIDNSF